jgi:hypothetical protein
LADPAGAGVREEGPLNPSKSNGSLLSETIGSTS